MGEPAEAAFAAATAIPDLEVVAPELPEFELEPEQVAFLETEELGVQHIGALTGSEDAASKLVAVLRQRVASVGARAVCANPLVTRILRPK